MIDFNLLIYVVAGVFVYMNLLFVLAVALKKNDIVDIAWGMGFVLVSVICLLMVNEYSWRRMLVNVMVIVWGLRLAGYIFLRNKGKKEDFRYAQWRKDWGKNWLIRSYLQVFLLQGFFMLTISYPIVMAARESMQELRINDILGILVWLIGFAFEAIGDAQMMSFKRETANRGKIMDRGLWRYTRHPNYFGESAMWWGIFLIMLSYPLGWAAVFSPVIISFLLVRVSGVPMLEKKYADNPAYLEYIRKTSSFLPTMPKR